MYTHIYHSVCVYVAVVCVNVSVPILGCVRVCHFSTFAAIRCTNSDTLWCPGHFRNDINNSECFYMTTILSFLCVAIASGETHDRIREYSLRNIRQWRNEERECACRFRDFFAKSFQCRNCSSHRNANEKMFHAASLVYSCYLLFRFRSYSARSCATGERFPPRSVRTKSRKRI